MRGQFVCTQWKYDFTNLMAQRKAPDDAALSGTFVAVIEPYAGDAFIRSLRRLKPAPATGDARSAVAAEVKLMAGAVDVCFADGNPAKPVSLPEADWSVQGEFAHTSRDAEGLRRAALVGGTLLRTPDFALRPAVAEYRGRVTKVDYWQKKLWVDARWPATETSFAFEVGYPEANHWTTCTAVKSEHDGDGSVFTLQRGADYYRSNVQRVEEQGVVVCGMKSMLDYTPGNRAGWVASDDDATRFWRSEYLTTAKFKLTGNPVSLDAFGKKKVMRLWEYGVGDTVRQSTCVGLRRMAPGVYAVEGNVSFTLQRPKGVQLLIDGKPAGRSDPELTIKQEDVISGRASLRFAE